MAEEKFSVRKKSFFLFFFVSVLILAAAFVISLCLGAERLNFFKTTVSLFSGQADYKTAILFNLRLPRSLLVLLTGILLGGSGAIFQLFFRNPLAEPGILGISSGATLGAVIATFFGLYGAGDFFLFKIISPINLFAFCGALLSGIIVTLLALTNYGRNSSVMLSALISVSPISTASAPKERTIFMSSFVFMPLSDTNTAPSGA